MCIYIYVHVYLCIFNVYSYSIVMVVTAWASGGSYDRYMAVSVNCGVLFIGALVLRALLLRV